MWRGVFIIILAFNLISLATATAYVDCDIYGNCKTEGKVTSGSVNYTIVNTNSSNFWDNLDTPNDIIGSAFWYNFSQSTTLQDAYNNNLVHDLDISINRTQRNLTIVLSRLYRTYESLFRIVNASGDRKFEVASNGSIFGSGSLQQAYSSGKTIVIGDGADESLVINITPSTDKSGGFTIYRDNVVVLNISNVNQVFVSPEPPGLEVASYFPLIDNTYTLGGYWGDIFTHTERFWKDMYYKGTIYGGGTWDGNDFLGSKLILNANGNVTSLDTINTSTLITGNILNRTGGSWFDGVCYINGTGCPVTTNIIYYPNITATSGGTPVDNNITLMYYYDDISYNITEGAGANPLTTYVNFTNVTTFTKWITREYYKGSASHHIQFEIWDYPTTSWQSYWDIVGQDGFNVITLDIYDQEDHVSNGVVQVRYNHIQNGISSHELDIDFTQLEDTEGASTAVLLNGYAKYNFADNNFLGFGNFTTSGLVQSTKINTTTIQSTAINSTNVTINDKFCFTSACNQYMYYNGSSIIIQG